MGEEHMDWLEWYLNTNTEKLQGPVCEKRDKGGARRMQQQDFFLFDFLDAEGPH